MAKHNQLNEILSNVISVLVADDDYDDYLLFEHAINALRLPFTITHLSKSKSLMDALSLNRFDIIFLNLFIPVKTGMKCLTEIKQNEKYKNVPVAFLTRIDDELLIRRCFGMGANNYILKLHSVKDMIVLLKNLFAQPDLKLTGTMKPTVTLYFPLFNQFSKN